MIPLSGFLSRVLSTRVLFFTARHRLHRRERAVRDGDLHRPDDRLSGAAGLHRRRHDPERVRRRLLDLSAVEAEHRLADDRPRRDAGADDRADGRRLSERCLFLALAVSGQRRAGHPRRDRRLFPRRLRQAGSIRCSTVSTMSGLVAMAVCSARSNTCSRKVRATTGSTIRRSRRSLSLAVFGARRILLARVHGAPSRSSSSAPSATGTSRSGRSSASRWASAFMASPISIPSISPKCAAMMR